MKTIISKIRNIAEDIDKLKQAADCIDNGGLVVFPTETVYGIACKVDKKSFARLDEVKKRDTNKRYSLHIGDKARLQDFVPAMPPPAKKLVENALPGPITIVFEISADDLNKLKNKFNNDEFELLYKDNTIGIRCPENDVAQQLLNLCRFPVVAPSANLGGREPATNAQQAIEQLNGLVDMILDSGPCKYKKNSTVVKISSNNWQILREGIYSEKQIQKMLTVNILFVCTGNTCRSPMAEGFAKKILAEKLKCDVDELEKIGYKIISAGVSAIDGASASAEAVKCCKEKNISLTAHKSRRLTAKMLREADYIFAMSGEHIEDIKQLLPQAAQKCMLLSDKGNITDPFGQGDEAYKICCSIIEKSVNKRICELLNESSSCK